MVRSCTWSLPYSVASSSWASLFCSAHATLSKSVWVWAMANGLLKWWSWCIASNGCLTHMNWLTDKFIQRTREKFSIPTNSFISKMIQASIQRRLSKPSTDFPSSTIHKTLTKTKYPMLRLRGDMTICSKPTIHSQTVNYISTISIMVIPKAQRLSRPSKLSSHTGSSQRICDH